MRIINVIDWHYMLYVTNKMAISANNKIIVGQSWLLTDMTVASLTACRRKVD